MTSAGVHRAQKILAALGSYAGEVDGIAGPQSLAAAAGFPGAPPRDATVDRQVIAGAQRALAAAGFDPGPGDGYFGPQTDAAYLAWQATRSGAALPDRGAEADFGRQKDMAARFGPAGEAACTAGKIAVPFDMVLAWDTSVRIRAIACHAEIAASAQRAFDHVAMIYSARERADLGFDQYGGCYNYRPMRGGTALSTHAWGLAIDFDPARNRLTWGRDRARLAHADAAPFWDIWAAQGWTSLGRARNFDWMHVQAVAL